MGFFPASVLPFVAAGDEVLVGAAAALAWTAGESAAGAATGSLGGSITLGTAALGCAGALVVVGAIGVAAYAVADRSRAENAADVARSEKEQIEELWRGGIQPVVTPNLIEQEMAKRRVQYQEGFFHFAVTGTAGSGKSSLINAFRGLRNRETAAAATGVTETTLTLQRYPDPDTQQPVVWYDVPGAGTLDVPDWQYFNTQGLYIFDCIIVLFDNRFTATDIAILRNSARFNIPAYIVRSKADQQIRNTMREMGYDSDDENGDPGFRNRLYQGARQQFIEETRRNVSSNLKKANLPDRRVYIISNNTLLSVIKEETPRKAIDEVELRRDMVNHVLAKRGIVGTQV
ncbi:interferon-inducible GTPase-domain-containing protein [Pisolithus marmoratus]|nr:interferon-inducible GTPase-domain-containing protein [Pisolithus marmoratus]